ncbi:hypothetical protein KP509_02G066700 [Ceratopteris richardii]|uniref:Histone-lysine N-methyltransferase SUVR4 n=1 Tax=Ceratopteris richardii TaxID=49495 RepID=A0A8T2VDV6_CERRI|nr:hypothetical protein KP509_02G066700 [Ceratopteris richardii]
MDEDKERFRRALDFMKTLGLHSSVVSPILRRLLKLYENEWSLIEEENYRALADSYFDQLENKDSGVSARVTRSSSRRGLSVETRATETPGTQLVSAKKKSNKRVTFSPESTINHVENGGCFSKSVMNADIACSYSAELQLECLSYKEIPPADSVHYQRGSLRRPKINTAISDSSRSELESQVHHSLSMPRAVKEEPLEFPSATERKDDAFQPAALPAASILTQEQGKQIVLFNKEHKSKLQNNYSGDLAKCHKPRKKLAIIAHSEGSIRKEGLESLLCIATAYGNVSDDESGVSAKHVGKITEGIPHSIMEVNCTATSSRSISEEKDANLNLAMLCTTPAVPCNPSNQKQREATSKPDFPHDSVMLNRGQEISVLEDSCSDHMPEERGNIDSGPAVPYKRLVLRRKGSSSSKLVATVKEEPICAQDCEGQHKKYILDEYDISRGQELFPILVSNSVSNESVPHTFCYIKSNITFQNAYVNFALARIGEEDCCAKCIGNCLESYPPCHCARETSGEFAYNLDGRLRQSLLQEAIEDKRNTESSSSRNKYCDKFSCLLSSGDCKGHLIRKFVKECWSKCGCDMRCGNRVVQKGICRKLQVSYISRAKGWGLRTLEDLPSGSFVCEYVGEILTNTELDKRNAVRAGHSYHYPTLLDADLSSETILQDEELLCLDATNYGNVARFINHRCYDANLVDIPVEIESPDHHYYHLFLLLGKFKLWRS